MFLQKLKFKIKYFLSKIKRKSGKSRLILNNIKNTPFLNKRRNFVIKNEHLEKLNFFWNNVKKYYILIGIFLILLILYIIFWPLFKIKNIEIIKQDNITNMIISYKSIEDYRWKSIWKSDKKILLNTLKTYQQNIRDIKVSINLPNTLKIIIDSYKWIFNTTINDKTYIITENWALIPTAYSTDLNELIVKDVFDKGKSFDYKKIFDEEYIKKILVTKKSLEENIINIKIDKLIYYVVEREFHIVTNKNTTIIFDLETDPKLQVEKLAIFNKEQLDIDKNELIYIDLRINNKIFYCALEEKNQCIQNLKNIYWQ